MLPFGYFIGRTSKEISLGFRTSFGIINMEVYQVRGRKRGNRQLSNAEKLARRQLREKKLAEKKTFMQRVQMGRIREAAKSALKGLQRYDALSENKLEDDPKFNIYYKDDYKTQFYSVAKALEMHRRLQSHSIYDNPDALLKLRMELNMTTEKSNKFIANSRQLTPIPFPFKHKEKRTILAFAPDKETQDEAILAGADLALGPDSIKKILKGRFLIDDYDFCVAHQDMIQTILPLRGILKARFPTKSNDGIGADLKAILAKFLAGVNLVVKGNLAYPQWGICEPLIGRLNMADENIESNIETIVTVLCRLRNPALGSFINRALLMTVGLSTAHYTIDVSKWQPTATEADKQKIEKKRKKNEEKAKIIEEEEEDSATKFKRNTNSKEVLIELV